MRRKLNLPSRRVLATEVVHLRQTVDYVGVLLYKAVERLAAGGDKSAILEELKGEVDADIKGNAGTADSQVPAAG